MSVPALTRSVRVLGGGIASFAAAVAFRRALPEAEVTLFLGGAAQEPGYAGAAAPSIHRFHRLVGIDPELFRQRTGAVSVQEADVRCAGRPAFRLVGLAEAPYVDGAALHQLWLRRTAQNPASGPAWAEVARRTGAVEGLGVRFDAQAYLALLADLAAHVGVTIMDQAPEVAQLADSSDLVIEARDTEEGGEWLRLDDVPGDFAWSVGGTGEAAEVLEIARPDVRWTNPAWRAEGCAGSRPAGRVRAPWKGNVLAVGRAALRCETFDGQPLAVALAGIARAIELLPRPGSSEREAAEYNRRTNAVHDLMLDWATERWGAGSGLPAGLVHLRGQFAHRGRIPFRDEDPVPPGQWLGWLLGSGERPQHLDLTAMAVSEERLAAIFVGV